MKRSVLFISTLVFVLAGVTSWAQTPPSLLRIEVTPTAQTIKVGQTKQFAAAAVYSDGSRRDITSSSLWSSWSIWTAYSINLVTLNNSGLATAVQAGAATIKAEYQGVTGSTGLTIQPVLSRITVLPAASSVKMGSTLSMTAYAYFNDGSTKTLTSPTVTWSSSAPGTATINASGVVTPVAVGSVTITALSDGISGSTSLSVQPPPPPKLVSIAVTPNLITVGFDQKRPSICVGTVQQFRANGTYNNGTTSEITSLVTWSSATPSVASINSAGRVTAVAPGATSIWAKFMEGSTLISGYSNLNVHPKLVSIAVTPANLSMKKGITQQFDATGTLSNGTTRIISSLVAWGTSNAAVASIVSTGRATGLSYGTTSVTAIGNSNVALPSSYYYYSPAIPEDVAGSTLLTVQPDLTSIAVTPANSTVKVGTTQPLIATGSYNNGTTQVMTSSVIWTSLNSAIATVNASGAVTSIAPGTTTLTAQSGTISGSTSLTIKSAVSLEMILPSTLFLQGNSRQMIVKALYSDGSIEYPTSAVWTSSNSNAVAVNTIANGYIEARDPGTSTLTVSYEGISVSVSVTVQPRLVSLAIPLGSIQVNSGASVSLTAQGTYSDGTTRTVAPTGWSSSNPAVATVLPSGVATAVGTGTTTMAAQLEGLSATISFNVLPQLVSMEIFSLPGHNQYEAVNTSMGLGTTQTLGVWPTFSDGFPHYIPSVTWTSSNTDVAAIGPTGLLTTVGPGNVTITATAIPEHGGLSTSVSLRVQTPPVFVCRAITPTVGPGFLQIALGNLPYGFGQCQFSFNGSGPPVVIATGQTKQFTVIDGRIRDGSNVITWFDFGTLHLDTNCASEAETIQCAQGIFEIPPPPLPRERLAREVFGVDLVLNWRGVSDVGLYPHSVAFYEEGHRKIFDTPLFTPTKDSSATSGQKSVYVPVTCQPFVDHPVCIIEIGLYGGRAELEQVFADGQFTPLVRTRDISSNEKLYEIELNYADLDPFQLGGFRNPVPIPITGIVPPSTGPLNPKSLDILTSGPNKNLLAVVVKKGTISQKIEIHTFSLTSPANPPQKIVTSLDALSEASLDDYKFVALADKDGDGNDDLVMVQKIDPSSRMTNVRILRGPDFQTSLFRAATVLEEAGSHFEFLYGPFRWGRIQEEQDLLVVRKSAGPGGYPQEKTEMMPMTLSGSEETRWTTGPISTALAPSFENWQFLYFDYDRDGYWDPVGVKKWDTVSGRTEISVLKGLPAGNDWRNPEDHPFHSFLLQTESALPETGLYYDFAAGWYNSDPATDLIAVLKPVSVFNTTAQLKVSILNGADHFASFLAENLTFNLDGVLADFPSDAVIPPPNGGETGEDTIDHTGGIVLPDEKGPGRSEPWNPVWMMVPLEEIFDSLSIPEAPSAPWGPPVAPAVNPATLPEVKLPDAPEARNDAVPSLGYRFAEQVSRLIAPVFAGDPFQAEIQICINRTKKFYHLENQRPGIYDYYPPYFHIRAFQTPFQYQTSGSPQSIGYTIHFSVEGQEDALPVKTDEGQGVLPAAAVKNYSDQRMYALDQETRVGWVGVTPWEVIRIRMHHPKSRLMREDGSSPFGYLPQMSSAPADAHDLLVFLDGTPDDANYWPPDTSRSYKISGTIQAAGSREVLATFEHQGTIPMTISGPVLTYPRTKTSDLPDPFSWSCDGDLVRIQTTLVGSVPPPTPVPPPPPPPDLWRESRCPRALYEYVRDDFDSRGWFESSVTGDACMGVVSYGIGTSQKPDYLVLEENIRAHPEILGFRVSGGTISNACFQNNTSPEANLPQFRRAVVGEYYASLKRLSEAFRGSLEQVAHLRKIAQMSCDASNPATFGLSVSSSLLQEKLCNHYRHIPGGEELCQKFKYTCGQEADFRYAIDETNDSYIKYQAFKNDVENGNNLIAALRFIEDRRQDGETWMSPEETATAIRKLEENVDRSKKFLEALEGIDPWIATSTFQEAVDQEIDDCVGSDDSDNHRNLCELRYRHQGVCKGIRAQALEAAVEMSKAAEQFGKVLNCVNPTVNGGNPSCTTNEFREALKKAPSFTKTLVLRDEHGNPTRQGEQADLGAFNLAAMTEAELINNPYCRQDFRGYLDQETEYRKMFWIGSGLTVLSGGASVAGGIFRTAVAGQRLWAARFLGQATSRALDTARIAAADVRFLQAQRVLDLPLFGYNVYDTLNSLSSGIEQCRNPLAQTPVIGIDPITNASCPVGPGVAEAKVVNDYRNCVLRAIGWSSLSFLPSVPQSYRTFIDIRKAKSIKELLQIPDSVKLTGDMERRILEADAAFKNASVTPDKMREFVDHLREAGFTRGQSQDIVASMIPTELGRDASLQLMREAGFNDDEALRIVDQVFPRPPPPFDPRQLPKPDFVESVDMKPWMIRFPTDTASPAYLQNARETLRRIDLMYRQGTNDFEGDLSMLHKVSCVGESGTNPFLSVGETYSSASMAPGLNRRQLAALPAQGEAAYATVRKLAADGFFGDTFASRTLEEEEVRSLLRTVGLLVEGVHVNFIPEIYQPILEGFLSFPFGGKDKLHVLTLADGREYALRVNYYNEGSTLSAQFSTDILAIPENARPSNLLSDTIGQYTHFAPGTRYLESYLEEGEKLWEKIRRLDPQLEDKTELLKDLSDYYEIMLNAHYFMSVNNSVLMNEVNYVLSLHGLKPMYHGNMDYYDNTLGTDEFRRFFREEIKANAIP